MVQPIFIPQILNCARCGEKAIIVDWNFDEQYQVICDSNHTIGRPCGTRNKAIHHWNNSQKDFK